MQDIYVHGINSLETHGNGVCLW